MSENTVEVKSKPQRPAWGHGKGPTESVHLRPAAYFALGVWRDLLNRRLSDEGYGPSTSPEVYLDRVEEKSADPVYAALIAFAEKLAAAEPYPEEAHNFPAAEALMEEHNRIAPKS